MEAGVDFLHIGFLHGLHHQDSQLLRRGMFGCVSAGDGKGAAAVGHDEILSVLGLVVETVSGCLHLFPAHIRHMEGAPGGPHRLAGLSVIRGRRRLLPAYSDKYRKKTLRLGDLLHLKEENVQVRIKTMLESKNLELAGSYHQEPMSYPALLSWCEKQASLFAPYICDTGSFLENALASHKKVVLEAQLGAMRDIDYGIFPYTSSSSTISAYGPIGAGIPGESPDHVVGVLKAYSTCVGAGPFVAERAMSEDWCNILRKFGNEYGAATGRPRRVGPFDAVASRYGLKCQHADKIALTKLDVLSSLTEIPVITAYERNHKTTTVFDPTENIDSFSPVVTMLPGWKQDISACRKYEDLPENARLYIETLERLLDCDIQFISTGAERNEYMIKGEWL